MRQFSWLGRSGIDGGIEVFGCAEGVHRKAGEEGVSFAEICREARISQATYFNWRKKSAGLIPSEMKRLRELEQKNAQLNKIVADLSLDK
ncbi:transposase [Rhodobacterales bacterium]|nr:transposase [Rhodobacterales bacterium]